MTLPEKIADKSQAEKLQAIDSNIENCIKIMHEELRKRKVMIPGWQDYIDQILISIDIIRDDFQVMKDRR